MPRANLRLIVVVLLVALGRAHAAGTFESGKHDGWSYRLFVPSADGGDANALVVALHGCDQTPEDFAGASRLNDAADRRRLLVLYPAQRWTDNPARCWNWFDPPEQSGTGPESAAILAMVAAVKRQHPVRRDRTVIVGFSAGAFMAVNLLCTSPDAWSGIGVAAGGPYRCGAGLAGAMACMRGVDLDPARSASACGSSHPRAELRASLWHGADDTTVSPAALDALATMLAQIIGAAPSSTSRDGGAVHRVYTDRERRPRLDTWLVDRMGHAWSGGEPHARHTFPAGPPATDRMLDFLLPASEPARPERGTSGTR